jgi:hypothetical protein
MVPTQGLLEKAQARTQRRFRTMVQTQAYADPTAPETRLYTQAERLVDRLLEDARWERTKAELDMLQAIDLATDESVRWHYDLDR